MTSCLRLNTAQFTKDKYLSKLDSAQSKTVLDKVIIL